MTQQAENFRNLMRGNSIGTIKMALKNVNSSVRNQLAEQYGTSDLDELAIKLC